MQYTHMSFTMNALAATVQGLDWSDTVVMLHEGCVWYTSMSFTTSPRCCCIGPSLEWYRGYVI